MMARQARRTLHQEGRGRLEVRLEMGETMSIKLDRKLLHTSFRKYMHNPLYNESAA